MDGLKKISLKELCLNFMFPQEYINEIESNNIEHYMADSIDSIKRNLKYLKFKKEINIYSGKYFELKGDYQFFPSEELEFEKNGDLIKYKKCLSPGILISNYNGENIDIYSHPKVENFLFAQYLVKNILKKESMELRDPTLYLPGFQKGKIENNIFISSISEIKINERGFMNFDLYSGIN